MSDWNAVFSEEQRIPRAWLLLFLPGTGGSALVGWGVYQQVVLHRPFGTKPLSDAGLLAIFLLSAGVISGGIWLIGSMKLTTAVEPGWLHVTYRPFVNRRIALTDIMRWEACTYRALRDYGGWGIRWGLGGQCYNARGNRGVQLVLAGGKRLLIGSQRAEEFASALTQAKGAMR